MTTRRRSPRRTRRPEVHPPSWKRLGWQPAPNARTGPTTSANPYAHVEAELAALRGPAALSGNAGKYALTLPSGTVVTVLTETDAETRVAHAILGTGGR